MMVPFFKFTRALDAADLHFFSVFFVTVVLKSRETFIDPRSIIVNSLTRSLLSLIQKTSFLKQI